MEKVLQLIKDKKIRVESSLYKAKLITERSEVIQNYINELEDYCSQLTEAELLLLNKPTKAITEAAHLANTMLGECADSDANQSIGVVGADSSETAVVRQNEQTKEFCNDPLGHSLMYYNMETGDTICCICQKKIKVIRK